MEPIGSGSRIQHLTVPSVLTPQPIMPPKLTEVKAPAGGGKSFVSPPHAMVPSVLTPHGKDSLPALTER
jgi:hypothetical protein